jgi:hypothetical protein
MKAVELSVYGKDTLGKPMVERKAYYPVDEVDPELNRLRGVLQKISAWGCNGQCVEFGGAKCPCCMAQEALGGE